MANGDAQVIIENGRVTGLFKIINGVAVVLISALLIWVAVTLTVLSTQVAVLISQNETRINEHTTINDRITTLEREWRSGDGIDSRDK